MDRVSPTSYNFGRPEAILFAVQVIVILLVVIVSLVNLTLEIGQLNLWTVLLTSCLGYILPNPKLKSVSEVIKGPTDTTDIASQRPPQEFENGATTI